MIEIVATAMQAATSAADSVTQQDSSLGITVGGILGVVAVSLTSAYGIVMGHGKRRAEARADTAESSAATASSDAQTVMYTAITERLRTLEQTISKLEDQLEATRNREREGELTNRKLLMHVIRLEALMRAAGVDIPPLDIDIIKGRTT